MPDFITQDITVYYEIDTNVWRSEKDDSWQTDKALVSISSVTVFGQTLPDIPTNVTAYDDNLAPQIEDCVAVDYLRVTRPTLMSELYYEFDKSNSLYVLVQNIDYSTKIYRDVYADGDFIYRFCYLDATKSELLYCTIEQAS